MIDHLDMTGFVVASYWVLCIVYFVCISVCLVQELACVQHVVDRYLSELSKDVPLMYNRWRGILDVVSY